MQKNILIYFFLYLFFVEAKAISIYPDSTKTHFVFSLDSHKSFIKDKQANIFGFKLGFEFRKFKTGMGMYFLIPEIDKNTILRVKDQDIEGKINIKFSYISIFGEYIFFKDKRWYFSLPITLGSGDIRLNYIQTSNNQIVRKSKIPVGIIEPSIFGQYKPLRWLGLGLGIGYRQMITGLNEVEENFNSPIYAIRIKIFFGEIFKMIKEKKIEKKLKNGSSNS